MEEVLGSTNCTVWPLVVLNPVQTNTVEARLNEYNTGKSVHTNKHNPWKCIAYFAFEAKDKAEKFEIYFKQGSGHAFAKKHFW